MEKGYWSKGKRVKAGAYDTIDNVTKFALFEEDYEYFEEWVEYTPDKYAERRISELKRLLADTDYIAAKIAEGAATRDDYADVIAQRQQWRDEINEQSGSLEKTCCLVRTTFYDEDGVEGYECDECGFSEVHDFSEPLPDKCPRCNLPVAVDC